MFKAACPVCVVPMVILTEHDPREIVPLDSMVLQCPTCHRTYQATLELQEIKHAAARMVQTLRQEKP